MDDMNINAAIEAVLFAIGSAVEESKLIEALSSEEKQITKNELKQHIEELEEIYDSEDRGIRIIELDGKYQLCTKNEYYDILAKIVNMPKKHVLTDVLLETLSIVAYKQPVTRAEIEKIRGVSCSHAVNRLVEYNLVCEVGRLDAPGHPILFGTTDDFLRSFGISSMDDLPDISPDKIEDFRKQAQEEAGIEVTT
ncbi:MAG: SMC-Scp complex subunit ScpB [Eubacterium sp.]|nr:SMC-Scp complex subunit ScpB [Eubacterium sp.]